MFWKGSLYMVSCEQLLQLAEEEELWSRSHLQRGSSKSIGEGFVKRAIRHFSAAPPATQHVGTSWAESTRWTYNVHMCSLFLAPS